jgi:hypothetical protein
MRILPGPCGQSLREARFGSPVAVVSSPLVADRIVCCGSTDGIVHALR